MFRRYPGRRRPGFPLPDGAPSGQYLVYGTGIRERSWEGSMARGRREKTAFISWREIILSAFLKNVNVIWSFCMNYHFLSLFFIEKINNPLEVNLSCGEKKIL